MRLPATHIYPGLVPGAACLRRLIDVERGEREAAFDLPAGLGLDLRAPAFVAFTVGSLSGCGWREVSIVALTRR